MTSSVADHASLEQVRRRVFLALFTALAVALHTLEALWPSPAPWFRLGLANILTLVALFLYGGGAAWTVGLGRVAIGSLLLGRLFTPGFWLALGGAVLATAVMVLARRLAPRRLGPIGISALGAAGHACGQMVVAWLVLIRHPGLWQIFPVLLLVAVVAGVLTGWVAAVLLERLESHEAFRAAGGAQEKP
jgi:heptaprenyl diphosphate synthase